MTPHFTKIWKHVGESCCIHLHINEEGGGKREQEWESRVLLHVFFGMSFRLVQHGYSRWLWLSDRQVAGAVFFVCVRKELKVCVSQLPFGKAVGTLPVSVLLKGTKLWNVLEERHWDFSNHFYCSALMVLIQQAHMFFFSMIPSHHNIVIIVFRCKYKQGFASVILIRVMKMFYININELKEKESNWIIVMYHLQVEEVSQNLKFLQDTKSDICLS